MFYWRQVSATLIAGAITHFHWISNRYRRLCYVTLDILKLIDNSSEKFLFFSSLVTVYTNFFFLPENEIDLLKVLSQNVKPNIDNKSPNYDHGDSSKVINVLIANSWRRFGRSGNRRRRVCFPFEPVDNSCIMFSDPPEIR